MFKFYFRIQGHWIFLYLDARPFCIRKMNLKAKKHKNATLAVISGTMLSICFILLVSGLKEQKDAFTIFDLHASCSEQSEKDPCHRKIYHNDHLLGCKHKAHLHPPTEKDGTACSLFLKKDRIHTYLWQLNPEEGAYTLPIRDIELSHKQVCIPFNLRAPPALTV
jgi:hypothetical protein